MDEMTEVYKIKAWCLYTMEFYSVTKKIEVLLLVSKWIGLENTNLSEVSQAQKAKSCMFFLIVEYRPNTNIVIL
jgi:hypothetical protein